MASPFPHHTDASTAHYQLPGNQPIVRPDAEDSSDLAESHPATLSILILDTRIMMP